MGDSPRSDSDGSEIGWQADAAASTTEKERAALALRSGPAGAVGVEEAAERSLMSGPGACESVQIPSCSPSRSPHVLARVRDAGSLSTRRWFGAGRGAGRLRWRCGPPLLTAGPQALARCAELSTALSVSMEEGVNALCAQFSSDGERTRMHPPTEQRSTRASKPLVALQCPARPLACTCSYVHG
jgi:hypothetical protein